MNMDERIARINELAHESKVRELTPEEKVEQQILRQEFIDNIRGNLKSQLDSVRVQRPDGTIEPLKKKTE